MTSASTHRNHTYRNSVILFVFLSFLVFPQVVRATIYEPGETLEPDCAPGSANCGVVASFLFLGTTTPIGSSVLSMEATTTSSVLATLRGISGQIANLFRVQDSTGSNLFSIGASGASQFSNTLTASNGLTIGSLTGLLAASGGVVSATTAPTLGYLAATSTTATSTFAGNLTVANNASTTNLIVSGTTGLSGLLTAGNASTTQISSTGSAYFATAGGNVGIGTTSPYAKLSVVGETVSAFFSATTTATSTFAGSLAVTEANATSTFAGGIGITGGGLQLGSLTSCHNLGTDSSGNLVCELGQYAVDVRKSADESVTASVVLQNDDELLFAIGANETWVFRFNLLYTTDNTTPDIQLAITAPAGATCDYAAGQFTTALSVGTSVCGASLAVTGGTTANQLLPLAGSISNGGTAGTVRLQFAQNTSSVAATTVLRGSILSAFRISGGADVGEVYYTKDISLLPGTVVALDPSLPGGVRKAMPGDRAIGVVSTKPGIVIGDTVGAHDGVPVIIALAGRVPVKVVTENGPIEPGDYLMPSTVEPGAAMKALSSGAGSGTVIGQAMSAYGGNGVGFVTAFVKNFEFGGYDHGTLADTTASSTLVADVLAETAANPIAVITQKIADGMQFLANFVAARVTALRGYFDELFVRTTHTDVLCVKKTDASEVCISGDDIAALLQNADITPTASSEAQLSADATTTPETEAAEETGAPDGTDVTEEPTEEVGVADETSTETAPAESEAPPTASESQSEPEPSASPESEPGTAAEPEDQAPLE